MIHLILYFFSFRNGFSNSTIFGVDSSSGSTNIGTKYVCMYVFEA